MVIDTSAIVAILLDEPEGRELSELLMAAREKVMSSVSLYEAALVMTRRVGVQGKRELDEIVRSAEIKIHQFDEDQAQFAYETYMRYGRGQHRASLNFADCASYALAKSMGEPLLFKGGAFALTDVDVAAA